VTKGFACGKGLRAVELHADPHRVRSPQRRGDDGFAPVSWDEALAEIGSRVQDIVARHGPRSVGVYIGNPMAFNAIRGASASLFAAGLGSDRVFSAATQDCTNKYAVAELLYGTVSANPIPDPLSPCGRRPGEPHVADHRHPGRRPRGHRAGRSAARDGAAVGAVGADLTR
jgi:anaerobic selenocysteine-containing dehydrogenase